MIIIENDELFIHFLMVAYLIKNKTVFLFLIKEITTCDISQIPTLMSSFKIQNDEDLNFIYNTALKLRDNTPYSFRILSNNLEIFVPYSDNLKDLYNFYQPDQLLSLPIFPSEVVYITYNYTFDCPDENCSNFIDSLKKLNVIDELKYNEKNLDKINKISTILC